MKEVLRIPPEQARPKVMNGEALLVCTYEDPASFHSMHLEGPSRYKSSVKS
jgi:hypothetical protein